MAPAVTYFFANAKSNVSKKAEDEMEMKVEDNNIVVISLKIVYEHQS